MKYKRVHIWTLADLWKNPDIPLRAYPQVMVKSFLRMVPVIYKGIRLYGLRWYFDGEYRARMRAKRSRKGRSAAHIVVKQRFRLLQKNRRCAMCGTKLTLKTSTLDHIVPLACGGANGMTNFQLLCKSCHMRKDADVVKRPPFHKIIHNPVSNASKVGR